MQEQILPVPFHGGQHVKLKDKFNSVIEIISTTAGDGKKYEMTCLPLRKLAAWLYSINPNKVAELLRGGASQYFGGVQ